MSVWNAENRTFLNPKKSWVVETVLTPTWVTGLESFLGLALNYQRFSQNFTRIMGLFHVTVNVKHVMWNADDVVSCSMPVSSGYKNDVTNCPLRNTALFVWATLQSCHRPYRIKTPLFKTRS